MKYLTRALVFSALIFSSCLSSESDLDKFPDGKLSAVTFKEVETGNTIEGVFEYEGDPAAPSKITITWSGSLRILQIPITDTKKITKTIYEFVEGRIVRITNVNDAGVNARVDEFTYDDEGYLTEHFLKEINVGGTGFFSYKNLFYFNRSSDNTEYDDYDAAGALQRVIQARYNSAGTLLYEGVFDRAGYNFTSKIPATITKTGDPLDFTYTCDPLNISNFGFDDCVISRKSNSLVGDFTAYTPTRVDGMNMMELPAFIGYDEGSGSLTFNEANSEYLAQLYYALGQWINPVYNKVDFKYNEQTGYHLLGETYGRNHSSWVFPRLNMATSYSDYVQAGFAFENTERRINVTFTSKIID